MQANSILTVVCKRDIVKSSGSKHEIRILFEFKKSPTLVKYFDLITIFDESQLNSRIIYSSQFDSKSPLESE